MWSSGSEKENEVVAIRRQRIDRSRVNYSETERSYEYNERLSLTCVNVSAPGNHLSRASNPKQLLQIALHLLSRGQQHSVGDMRGVSKASKCRAVHEVVTVVNKIMLPQWVHWPRKSLVYSERGRFVET